MMSLFRHSGLDPESSDVVLFPESHWIAAFGGMTLRRDCPYRISQVYMDKQARI